PNRLLTIASCWEPNPGVWCPLLLWRAKDDSLFLSLGCAGTHWLYGVTARGGAPLGRSYETAIHRKHLDRTGRVGDDCGRSSDYLAIRQSAHWRHTEGA